MVLTGVLEVEAWRHCRARSRPACSALVTDVDGMGHRTQVVGAQEVLLVWVPIP